MNVERARVAVVLLAPYFVQELLARGDAARSAREDASRMARSARRDASLALRTAKASGKAGARTAKASGCASPTRPQMRMLCSPPPQISS